MLSSITGDFEFAVPEETGLQLPKFNSKTLEKEEMHEVELIEKNPLVL